MPSGGCARKIGAEADKTRKATLEHVRKEGHVPREMPVLNPDSPVVARDRHDPDVVLPARPRASAKAASIRRPPSLPEPGQHAHAFHDRGGLRLETGRALGHPQVFSWRSMTSSATASGQKGAAAIRSSPSGRLSPGAGSASQTQLAAARAPFTSGTGKSRALPRRKAAAANSASVKARTGVPVGSRTCARPETSKGGVEAISSIRARKGMSAEVEIPDPREAPSVTCRASASRTEARACLPAPGFL
jgi:hypothetical protein